MAAGMAHSVTGRPPGTTGATTSSALPVQMGLLHHPMQQNHCNCTAGVGLDRLPNMTVLTPARPSGPRPRRTWGPWQEKPTATDAARRPSTTPPPGVCSSYCFCYNKEVPKRPEVVTCDAGQYFDLPLRVVQLSGHARSPMVLDPESPD
ncbi:hypothetical protein BV898_16592 [Hypsibius exemplaris]|uniref:Uncharacterized protein n=1 Tax=Hypsibius exemplaris TaxID=2072580 RepID=A0A9X6RLZ7_HYPEX|nr:hypothetical protein BV898_16592 [Hypsibius exemplaris]